MNEQEFNHPDKSNPAEDSGRSPDSESLRPRVTGQPLASPDSTKAAADSAGPELEGHIWQGRTDWRYYAGICTASACAIVIAWVIVIYTASHTSLTGGWAFLICVMITALVAMGVGLWILVQIVRTRYRLTDQRLFIERGVFSQTIDQIELIRVDDVRVRKKFVDRLLGLGSVELLTTDTSDAHLVIVGIRTPEKIAEHIRTRMRELRSRSLFIENL